MKGVIWADEQTTIKFKNHAEHLSNKFLGTFL